MLDETERRIPRRTDLINRFVEELIGLIFELFVTIDYLRVGTLYGEHGMQIRTLLPQAVRQRKKRAFGFGRHAQLCCAASLVKRLKPEHSAKPEDQQR